MDTKTVLPDNAYFIPGDDDGWTLPGYIDPVEGGHGEVRFTYRPPTVAERQVIYIQLGRLIQDAEGWAKLMSRSLAARIKSWNLKHRVKDEAGDHLAPAPITDEFVSRLRHPIWDSLASIIILQNRASDRDPRWAVDDKDEFDEAAIEAAITGAPKQAASDKRREGNSHKG